MDSPDINAFTKKWGVGLTGSVATGKSTVIKMLANRGFAVIDADELARLAVKPGTKCLNAIVDRFGPEILSPDGTLNRKSLGAVVFNDSIKRKALEAITHPEIQRLFNEKIVSLGLLKKPAYFFYEAALLFESGRSEHFSQIWATVCSPETQNQRLKQARKLDEVSAAAIIASQSPAAEKAMRAAVAINTDCGLPEVELQVAQALKKLTSA